MQYLILIFFEKRLLALLAFLFQERIVFLSVDIDSQVKEQLAAVFSQTCNRHFIFYAVLLEIAQLTQSSDTDITLEPLYMNRIRAGQPVSDSILKKRY